MLVQVRQTDWRRFTTRGEVTLRPVFVDYVEESCTGIVVYCEGHELTYVLLKQVSRYTPKLMSICGANIAGNYRCGLTADNHRDFYDLLYSPPVHWEEIKSARDYAQIIAAMDVSRITADHHLFTNHQEIEVLMAEVISKGDDESYERMAASAIMIETAAEKDIANKVSVITHVLYALIAPIFAVRHLMKCWTYATSPKEYMASLKNESQAAKQLQTVFRDDLSAVFELQVLRNRVFDDVDWRKEVSNRVNVQAVPVTSTNVYTRARNIFKDAANEGVKPRKKSWDQYWRGRWSSMPGGSVVSQYPEDKFLKAELPREGKIKAAWFSANRHNDQKYWLDREPQIFASTSTKYEWGKVRALYGCDVTSFLHSDFSMGECENMLPSYFPVGRRANSKYINSVIDRFSLGVPFCFDYDDFNSQHSTASMVAVLCAWRDVFGRQLSEEQYASLEWTIESVKYMSVRFNEIGKNVDINGTLMSGWRLTSFINSVLNRVYLEEAGLKANVIYALHNGDDMFATTANMQGAMNVVRRAKEIGIRAQVSKTNLGTIGEFLRVDTRATNRTGAQYLARSVATAVHGRVETGAPNDLFALHGANAERMKALVDRGGNVHLIRALSQKLTDFECALFGVDKAVLDKFDTTHPTQGGGCIEAGVSLMRLERVAEETTQDFKDKLKLIDSGIDDYVSLIIDKFKLRPESVSRVDVRNKAYDSLSRNRVRYKIVIETDERAAIYRGLFKAWAKSDYIAPISMLRSVGMANARYLTAVKGPVVELIANSKNPMKMMQTVF